MRFREFLSWNEAASALGGPGAPNFHPTYGRMDEEALRQAILIGRLGAFVELGHEDFTGYAHEDDRMVSGTTPFATWELLPRENEGGPVRFNLRGWFSLQREEIKKILRRDGMTGQFWLKPAGDGIDQPEFLVAATMHREGLWFRAGDVANFGAGESPASSPAAAEKPMRLRADREENLLRVIAGLWALSGLPVEHNTTADKLSALFDGWNWDKPAKSSIADTILKQAASLPGARIRTSD